MEDRREEIEREIENLKYYRKVLRKLYHKLGGIVSDKTLSDIIFDIHLMENRIEHLCEQLPPQDEVEKLLNEANKILNSDEKHLYLTELEEAERKLDRARQIIKQGIVGKAHEEALCKAADKTLQEYADIAAGRIFIDEDNVAHVNGTIETPRMVIEAAPRRTGRMFKSWLCNYFK